MCCVTCQAPVHSEAQRSKEVRKTTGKVKKLPSAMRINKSDNRCDKNIHDANQKLKDWFEREGLTSIGPISDIGRTWGTDLMEVEAAAMSLD